MELKKDKAYGVCLADGFIFEYVDENGLIKIGKLKVK